MILVIGGLAAGKREYVKKCYGYTDADISDAELDDKPVIYNLQNLVEVSPHTSMELLPALLEKEVVICNEVGCGIVPIEAATREAREATGRLCIELAAKAEKVVRVCCGIPVIIKG
jgi:adenosyl cobinamide kinase/adenosyl cobinamide phosphate guanylyltransferase